MSALLVIALVVQFRAHRYVPTRYWFVVVFISVVGTLISDYLVDNLGVGLNTTTIIFSVDRESVPREQRASSQFRHVPILSRREPIGNTRPTVHTRSAHNAEA